MNIPTRFLSTGMLATSTLAGALLLNACAEPQAAPASAPPAPAVEVATVIAAPVAERRQFSGRLAAVEQVDVRARVSGHVIATHFQDGALVRKGDLLFEIDPRPFQAALAQAEAAAEQAEARAQLLRGELARAERLAEVNAISREDLERKQADLRTAQAAVTAANAQVSRARIELGFTAVRAPIAGRAGKVLVTPGNVVVGEGGGTLLTTVVRTDPVYAEFAIDDRTYLDAAPALRTRAQYPEVAVDVGTLTLKGRLHFLDNAVDPSTGTLQARALVANPQGTLTPGLYARVTLATRSAAAIQVRETAIGTDQDRRFVLVVGADNKVAYREVELGPLNDGLRVIRKGLAPQERIVVNGLQRVQPGMPVQPRTVAMAAAPAPLTLSAR